MKLEFVRGWGSLLDSGTPCERVELFVGGFGMSVKKRDYLLGGKPVG